MSVSYPSGSSRMKSWAPASRAASMIRSIDAWGSDRAMFSRTLRLNSTLSCDTTPIWRRSHPARPRPLKPIKVLVYASESGRVEIMPYYRIAAKEVEENLGIDIRVEIDRILEATLPTFRARDR